jgi:hypothetical protein
LLDCHYLRFQPGAELFPGTIGGFELGLRFFILSTESGDRLDILRDGRQREVVAERIEVFFQPADLPLSRRVLLL